MIIRIWDTMKDKMMKQTRFDLLATYNGRDYWVIKAGLDDVELVETNQNCGELMYATGFRDNSNKNIYERDIICREWYSFKDDIVFDREYGIVYYDTNWRLKLSNGLDLNLAQNEEGRDYRVNKIIVGNYYEGYLDRSKIPYVQSKWSSELLPPLLSKKIFENTPAALPLA